MRAGPQPIAYIRQWQAAIADPAAYTTELLSLCRLLCAGNCPREASNLIKAAGNASLAGQDAEATRQLVARQVEQAYGRFDARDVLFQDAPGPLSEFVSSRLRIKVRAAARTDLPAASVLLRAEAGASIKCSIVAMLCAYKLSTWQTLASAADKQGIAAGSVCLRKS